MYSKKRSIFIVFLALLIISSLSVTGSARSKERDIKIWINDFYIMSDVHPFVAYSRSYVPIRFVAEELGYDVAWDQKTSTASISNDNIKADFKIGSKEVLVNKEKRALETPVMLKEARTFVPLRLVAEIFGEEVKYDDSYKVAIIGEGFKSNKSYPVKYYLANYDVKTSDFKVRFDEFLTQKTVKVGNFETDAGLSLESEKDLIKYIDEEMKKVNFKDPNFELLIRDIINKPKGDIYPEDMEKIKEIKSLYPKDDYLKTYITDITGIEYAINLESLYLWRDGVKDISPLANLKKLKFIDLTSNGVSNIEALRNLTNLEELHMDYNKIEDVSPISNLNNLKELNLSLNNIKNLDPIRKFKHLDPFGWQEAVLDQPVEGW